MKRHDDAVPVLITDPKLLERRAVTRYLEYLDSNTTSGAGELEIDFIESAARYSVRLGLGIDAWRLMGVPDSVLERAGFG